jgi:acetoin utilization deacetylase AcuC-like enzyme
MHGAKNFPLRKMRSSIDVNLPDKCGDDFYLKLLNENMEKALELCRDKSKGKNPSIVFYLAGVDVVEVILFQNWIERSGRQIGKAFDY